MTPKGWEAIKLNDVCDKVTSGSRNWAQYYSEEGSKFIRMTNLQRNSIYLDLSDLKFVDIQDDSSDGKRTSLKAGDILMSITAELGKIGWVHEGLGESFINQHTALIRLKENKAYSKYIAYLLSSKEMNHRINRLNDSGAKAGLNLTTIRSIPLTIAPVSEQQKIAKILTVWDKAISTTERLIDNSTQQKKALMQQLLTGKKRLLNESGKQFKGEWEETALIDTADSKKYSFTGGPFGSDLKSSDYSTTGVRIIQLQNIGDGCFNNGYKIYTTEEKADQLISCNIYPNEIIISKMGDPVARATLIPDFHSRYLMASDGIRLAVNKSKYDTNFVLETINSSAFRGIALSKSTGSTRRRIGLTDLKNITFNCPALPEQQKIATVLTNADKEVELLEQQLADLQQEKKALMQVLLTGKKRVKLND